MTTPQRLESSTAPESPTAKRQDESYPAIGYAWYVVGILTIAYIFSFIDRQILNLLVAPIRRDLGISDTQMSLLMGFSFAVFYTLFGIPLGRLADSKSRRSIIAVGIVFWSLMTAVCGLAKNFWHLLLARIGVGVGEAALSPAAYSLIADYFPKEKRATAISVYSMGIYIGGGLASLLGGLVIKFASAQERLNLPLVGSTRPWQVVFFIVGLAGIFFSVFMYTVREPLRQGLRAAQTASAKAAPKQVPLSEVMDYVRANRTTFICHNVGFALLSFSSYGSSAWIPTMFIRRYEWTAAQIGIVYGLMLAIFGTLGIVFGGWMADRMRKRGRRDANMWVGLIGSAVWFVTGIPLYLSPSDTLAVWLLAPTAFFVSMPFGVAPAAIQEMTPNEMRGQASAIYLFTINLIGLGLGPTAVAAVTDYVFQNDNAVGYSLLVVTTIAHIISTILLWRGLNPYLQSLDRLQSWSATRPVS